MALPLLLLLSCNAVHNRLHLTAGLGVLSGNLTWSDNTSQWYETPFWRNPNAAHTFVPRREPLATCSNRNWLFWVSLDHRVLAVLKKKKIMTNFRNRTKDSLDYPVFHYCGILAVKWNVWKKLKKKNTYTK